MLDAGCLVIRTGTNHPTRTTIHAPLMPRTRSNSSAIADSQQPKSESPSNKWPNSSIRDTLPDLMNTSGCHNSSVRWKTVALVCGALAFALAPAGCRSPFAPRETSRELRQTVTAAIDRELSALPEPASDEPQAPIRAESPVEAQLADRREELEAIAPALPPRQIPVDLGTDLVGEPQAEVAITLREAITTAVANNLSVQTARLQPAIAWEDLLAAEAVFDAVLFGGAEYQSIEEPMPLRFVGDPPVLIGTGVNATDIWRFETGVRQPLPWGGTFSLSTDLMRSRNRTPAIDLSPDPAYAAAVRLGYVQPLLRGFGADANLATIRLSRNLQRRAVHELRSELLNLASETEAAYWNLLFAWTNLEIQLWLVEEGIQVRDVLERRRDFDARPAEFADAVATVEQRRANVVRARRNVRAASDGLKLLMNDPELSIGSEAVLVPVDAVTDSESPSITYSLRDAVMTAISNRPEIEQAILLIDDSEIRRNLARTNLLPQLDLLAEATWSGLDEGVGSAYREANRGDFLSYLFGLAFEWPIGNRAAEAEFRRSRLERSAAVLGYRQTVQNVILDVKEALRDVVANYELIGATRSFRIAQAENLRALRVREELVGLTPEFLNLLFTTQATLATARQEEIQAQVNFDQSVADLYRALGTGLRMHGIDVEYESEALGTTH